MDLRGLIAAYLNEGKLMQLATINEQGDPWVCSVWFAADSDLNIYWFSSITREHSQHIKANNHVAAAIVVPQTPNDTPRGLQLNGIAEELSREDDITQAKNVYIGRIFPKKTVDKLMVNPDKPHRFYRIKPSKFVLFDAVNYPENSRQEYELGKHE